MADEPAPLYRLIANQRERCTGMLFNVGFAWSRSPNYGLAVSLARQAAEYWTAGSGKSAIHAAGFAGGIDQLDVAMHLLRVIHAWSSAVFHVQGRAAGLWAAATDTLGCYREALLCHDYRAWCFVPIDDPVEVAQRDIYAYEAVMPRRIIFPCSRLLGWFQYSPEHPSTMADQVQAAAIGRGYDWCPFFFVQNMVPVASCVEE